MMNLPTVEQLGTMNADQLKALLNQFDQEAAALDRQIAVSETEKAQLDRQAAELRAKIKEIVGSDDPNEVNRFIANAKAEAESALIKLHQLYNPQAQVTPPAPAISHQDSI